MNVALIHPTAIIDPKAELGEGVQVGPFCVIEADTVVGAGSRLESHAVIRRWTTVGQNNVVKAGTVLGGDPQHLSYRGEKTELVIGNDNWFGEYATMHRATSPDTPTRIGDHNYFMAYSHVGHDCRVGNHVVLTNCAGLAGHCHIEDRVLLGGYSGAHQGVRIGTMAMLGGGALTGRDVCPYLVMQGAPAQPRGLNIIGMQRNGVDKAARRALQQMYRIIFLLPLSLPNAIDKVCAEVPLVPEVERFLDFIAASERGIARRKER
ncbi:MAG: acyl-ACP--UDP-N-acetylglucosamine O-acyltransferase [Candidatus Lernaella stagnicola]|nr:acyl-ACP--UDP-N-acetylglucosamine O-acyltransferase [Candidatus Lernaella stagnicola]